MFWSIEKDLFFCACLILAQRAHSVEEYLTRLHLVFTPARFVSSPGKPRSLRGFSVRERCSCNVRYVVLGCSVALTLAYGSQASVVLDASGAG
jgi:hypothetical protein